VGTTLRVLGTIDLEVDGRPVAIGGRRERALLTALLVARGHVVSVDRLADELWEGAPPAKATSALRVHVSRLRKALAEAGLPAALVTRSPGYQLSLDDVDLDAEQLEVLAARGRELLEDGDPRQAGVVLRQALSLWGGAPFADLAEVEVARAEAQRLEGIYCSAQEDRIEADLLLGRHRDLTAELDLLVHRYPTRERLWGQRMLALYRSGQQSDALAAYRDLRDRLASELGIDPSPALQQLEVAILCQDPALDITTRSVPDRTGPLPAPADAEPAREREEFDDPALDEPIALPPDFEPVGDGLPFVGRAVELDRLQRAWVRCRAGERHRVFLAGDPGIGKSTLAATMAGMAHADGGTVLLGHCDADALTPYQPFVEALRRYVAACPTRVLERRAAADLSELTRLVPELIDRVPGLLPPVDRGDADRLRLFEAVSTVLEEASFEHPVLLVLEDLHWADRPTILMLRHLARRTDVAKLFLLATYRDVDLDLRHPLIDLLSDLRRDQLGERFQLRGLQPAEIESMLVAAAGEQLGESGPKLAGALHRDTGGNPFFLREVVRHLRAQVSDAGRWHERLRSGELGLPEGVREVVGRRVTSLTDDANKVLAAAAVAGVTFSVEVVEAVTGLPSETVLDGAEQAAQAGLIAEIDRQPGWYQFTHALNREVVYTALSTVRRLRLHRLVAEELERRTADGLPSSDRTLAYHFLEAGAAGGAQEKAIEYCRRAGAAAMAKLAYEEAAEHYERALEVVTDLELDDLTVEIDLMLSLGLVRWRAGDPAMAPMFERAAELARRIRDAERFARAVLGRGLSAGGFAASVRASDTLIELTEEALNWLGPEDRALRVRLMARLSSELYFTPRWDEARRLAVDAVAMADRLGHPRAMLTALDAEAWASFALDAPPPERVRKAEVVLAKAMELDDLETAYRAEFLQQQTLLEIGDFAGADASCRRVEEIVRELRMPRFVPWVRSYQATRAFVAGDLVKADELVARAMAENGERDATEGATALIGGQQMAMRVYRGGLEPMVPFLEAMVDDLAYQNVVRAMLSVLHHELDQPAEAAAAWRASAAGLHQVPRDAAWLVYMWALGSTARFARAGELAEPVYQLTLPFADRWAVSTSSICFGPMSMPLGVLAGTLGWHEVAVAHLENSLAAARAVPAPVFEAAAEVELAVTLHEWGTHPALARAEDLVRSARKRSEDMGLVTLLHRLDELEA
jgi:DNA-binding SARP family transcriptional activator/energy-coupling factor transporter ATP-binding protein EcfA2